MEFVLSRPVGCTHVAIPLLQLVAGVWAQRQLKQPVFFIARFSPAFFLPAGLNSTPTAQEDDQWGGRDLVAQHQPLLRPAAPALQLHLAPCAGLFPHHSSLVGLQWIDPFPRHRVSFKWILGLLSIKILALFGYVLIMLTALLFMC